MLEPSLVGAPTSASLELAGKVAIVTGASRGIGRAIAEQLADAGADVLVHARANADAARQVADGIRQRGRQSHVILYDLANPTHQDWLLREAWSWRGRVDIWINNAGADVLTGSAADDSFEEKLEQLWRVDVCATIRLSREIGRRMGAMGGAGGVIVNVGWDQADWGMANESGQLFGATKGAVMAFTRSLAQSLAPAVRVHCVAPGWIKTAWGEHAPESWQRRACAESLAGRWGEPLDVAHVVRFLVGPGAGFLNGQTLHVNGGFRTGWPGP